MTTTNKLFIYSLAPIDFFIGAVPRHLEELVRTEGFQGGDHGVELLALLANAQRAFLSIGWDVYHRVGPYYFAIPDTDAMLLGIVVKQDNNGSTFVASPIPFPHLGEPACTWSYTS
ncbi:MAG: hypothetical protein KDE27_11380 [Planctomycetes bacterium]|nr:hypothetical protein [Planctomycetota bacterium]